MQIIAWWIGIWMTILVAILFIAIVIKGWVKPFG